jgi:hypothetical protein
MDLSTKAIILGSIIILLVIFVIIINMTSTLKYITIVGESGYGVFDIKNNKLRKFVNDSSVGVPASNFSQYELPSGFYLKEELDIEWNRICDQNNVCSRYIIWNPQFGPEPWNITIYTQDVEIPVGTDESEEMVSGSVYEYISPHPSDETKLSQRVNLGIIDNEIY